MTTKKARRRMRPYLAPVLRGESLRQVKAALRGRDGDDCFFCLDPMGADCTLEHLHRWADGGSNDPSNLALAHLTQHADNGWVCPSLPKLAQMTGINLSTVSAVLRDLRKAGKITSRLVHVKPHGQARVVTIIATGRSTATPQPSKRFNKPERPAFTPTETGAHVRIIPRGSKEHCEIERRLLARDAEDRRRKEMAL